MNNDNQKNNTSKTATKAKAAASNGASHRNAQTEFAQEQCALTDYDVISDVLGSHKSLIKLYGTALCEVSDKALRNLVVDQMTEAADDQLDAFNYMHDRDMYPTEPAPVQKVQQARERFCCCEREMER